MRSSFTSKLLLMFWLGAIIVSAQIKRVEFAASDIVTHCRVILLSDNSLLALYTKTLTPTSHSLYLKTSSDNGVTWGEGVFVDNIRFVSYGDSVPAFAGLKLNSGKVIIIYKDVQASKVVSRYSYDLVNWSDKVELPVSDTSLSQIFKNCFSLIQTGNNEILFICSSKNRGTYIYKSSDEGMSWRIIKEVSGPNTPFTFNGNNGKVLLVSASRFETGKIEVTGSSDYGETWKIDYNYIQHDRPVYNPAGRFEKDGTINVWFESPLVRTFRNKQYLNYEIYRVSSTDMGQTWSIPIPVTRFQGQDRYPHLTFFGDKSIMNFKSDRSDKDKRYNFYFGELTDNWDQNPPPYLHGYKIDFPNANHPNAIVSAYAGADTMLKNAKIILSTDTQTDSTELFDDGMHSDDEANDLIYGNTLNRLEQGVNYNINFSLTGLSNTNVIFGGESIFPVMGSEKSILFNVNKLSFPINNMGDISNISISSPNGYISSSGKYDDMIILFSGGFLISGFTNGTLWGRGMMAGALMHDFYPGIVESAKNDPRNLIYTVRSADAPFAPSWYAWKTAVETGARFYDGDKDGVYNPRDLNMNSQWDPSEDRPDLIGDLTAFCVYNDGVPANFSRIGSSPQKIEIRQTMFASGGVEEAAFNNSVFVRYSIINKNPGVPLMDEVFFGFWADPDLGIPNDDLIGSDTLRQSVFIYNRTPDNLFGVNPPALFSKIVQGPVSYVPGETYNDINQNSQYDEGVDIPSDTAYNKLGGYMGYELFPGAKNMPVYATACYLEYQLGDEDILWQMRNSLKGLSRVSDQPIDPCTFWPGVVTGGVNCANVNKRMIFSGDPVTNTGWICNFPTDQRMMISTGPFKLEYNKPVDIIVAYVAGRGSDQFNSIDVARGYADVIQSSYEKNFPELYKYEESRDTFLIIGSYELFQNHPNPFNPYTIIKYTVEAKSQVSVKVFDILGREVATPVDEEKEAGNYQIRFDSGTLSSGVYFYQFRAGNYVSTKKMILLR